MSFRLLRPYAFYKITYRGKAPTQYSPVLFVIYVPNMGGAPNKVHSLTLANASTMEVMRFVGFIRKMKKIPDSWKYPGRAMYRLLRTYYPDLVRKYYRTHFSTHPVYGGVQSVALISSGIIPREEISNMELSLQNRSIASMANRHILLKTLGMLTGTKIDPARIGTRMPPPPPPSFAGGEPEEYPGERQDMQSQRDKQIENETSENNKGDRKSVV